MAEISAGVQVQARWVLDPSAIPAPANQVLLQAGPPSEGVYISFGHLNPPVVDDAPLGALAQEQLDGRVFPVIPVARVLVSVGKLKELRDKIDQIVEQLEAQA